MSSETITVEIYDGDKDEEFKLTLPARYDLCRECEGRGTVGHPAFREHAITEEERDRDWSPEEWETYTSGGYDVECPGCKGLRVVLVPDEIKANPDDLALYRKEQRRAAELEREIAHEMRMGY